MGYATNLFSKRLKEIRETAGLTQAQLASELNVSRGAISYYEKGERTPDIEFLDALSMYFDLPLDFAMGITANIKEEHRNMYEFYGLTDEACSELDHDDNLGKLISAILGHENFYSMQRLYKGLIENHSTFDIGQLGYIGFLISDSLNKIIFDSLKFLWNIQFTPEELDALRIKQEINEKEFTKIMEEYEKNFSELKKKNELKLAADAKLIAKECALQHSAIDKVHEKFRDTIEPAEFRREFPR